MSHFHDRLFPKLQDSRLKELEKAAYQDADKLAYNEAKKLSDKLDDIEAGLHEWKLGNVVSKDDLGNH